MRLDRVNDIVPLYFGEVNLENECISRDSLLLMQKWETFSNKQGLPTASVITQEHLWPWMGRIVTIYARENRFRYNIFGSELAVSAGFDLSSTWMDDALDKETKDIFATQYNDVIQRPRICISHHLRISASVKVTRLILPFSTDGANPDVFAVYNEWSYGINEHFNRIRKSLQSRFRSTGDARIIKSSVSDKKALKTTSSWH